MPASADRTQVITHFGRRVIIPQGAKMLPPNVDEVRTLLQAGGIKKLYDDGYVGAYHDPEARGQFLQNQPNPHGEAVAYSNGLVGTGEGKLTLLFVPSYRKWPKCWPCPGQETGDCVGHGGKNCGLLLIGVEASLMLPDPETGIIEGYPEISAIGEEQGVVACENIYGARGHGGQGASCSVLQDYVTSEGGIMLRQNYPDAGVDFTRYNVNLESGWGSRGVPAKVTAEGAKHRIRQGTDAGNEEICRDFIANGYPIWACSGLGWSSNRDDNGYSRQQGSWSHSWVIMGYDDRDVIKQKYGFPLALYNHDWGKWNIGGRRIMGTDIDIPEGSMWIDARLLRRAECTAMSNMNGFPRRKLHDYSVI